MFVAQVTLEAWIESGKAEFDGEICRLKSHAKVYRLEPAVRFEAVVGGGDGGALIGKVISEKQVAELGGELLEDSVMFGDHAFQVRAGYIAVIEEAA